MASMLNLILSRLFNIKFFDYDALNCLMEEVSTGQKIPEFFETGN